MYNVDDHVFHHSEGLCRVVEIREMHRPNGELATYYILSPLYSALDTTVMVPLRSADALLRDPLSKAEADVMIKQIEDLAPLELSQKEIRTLQTLFELSSLDHSEIIRVIKGLIIRENKLAKGRKSLPITQKRVLRSAEKLIYDQLAVALSLTRDEVEEKVYALILEK